MNDIVVLVNMTTGIRTRCTSSKLRSLAVISLLHLVVCSLALSAEPVHIIDAVSEIRIDQAIQTTTTSGNSLDVRIKPSLENTDTKPPSVKFDVSFFKPNTSSLQQHVDFDLLILKGNKTVFKATNQTGQPTVPLHATDGYMSIPVLNYKFDEKGKYLIRIPVYGILFNPIRPETAEFSINNIT
jgi:hypothetical protein